MHWTFLVFLVGTLTGPSRGQVQRVAPGVPPQHYQQPAQAVHQPPPPQQHIPQQHIPQQQQYQQVPMQQVPVQQVPVQHHVPVQQQVPVQHHAHHGQPQQILNAANIADEKAHIAEHFEVPMNTSEMSDQELQFHYFKMHDADNNNMLDGCELIKSLIHWHEQGNQEAGAGVKDKLFTDDELVNLIDPILSMDDNNKDGYIDYPEFIQAQQNAASPGRQ